MRVVLLYIFLCFAFIMKGQNLVPNSSFETYYPTHSPSAGVNGVGYNNFYNRATNWYSVKGSVDLYTYHAPSDIDYSCMGSGERWQIPPTILGYNYPRTDSCYIGLCTWANFYSMPFDGHNYYAREWAGVRLLDSLKAGECYNYTMYVARATKTGYNVSCLGAYFSKDSLFTNNINGQYISPFPMSLDSIQVQQNPDIPIWDSTWIAITGTFRAKGGEQFLYIGNLLKDELYTPVPLNMQDSAHCEFSNFFIDDVSLYQIIGPCDVSINENILSPISIYPNPSNGIVTIESSKPLKQITIYNMFGQVVYSDNITATKTTIDLSIFSKGVYVVVVDNIWRKLVVKE